MGDRSLRQRRRRGVRRLRRATMGVVLAGIVLLAASARGGLGPDDVPYILGVCGATLLIVLLLQGAAAAVEDAPVRARVLGNLANLVIWACAGTALVLSVFITAEVISTPRCTPGATATGDFLPSCIEHPIRDRLDTLFVDGVAVLLIFAATMSTGALRLIRPPTPEEEAPEPAAQPATSMESIQAAAITARLQKGGSFSTWRD